ncbi:MAG TPA: type II toxin-antitoxin system HicA family toxin [Allocoleopsis sp.]
MSYRRAECVKALEQIGFVVARQRGSHIILVREEPKTTVSVPNHDELDRGTLRAIVR